MDNHTPEAIPDTELYDTLEKLLKALNLIADRLAALIVSHVERRGVGIYPQQTESASASALLPAAPAYPVKPPPIIDEALRQARIRGWFEPSKRHGQQS